LHHHPTHTPVTDIHTHLYPEIYLELLEARQEIPRVIRRGQDREFVIFEEEDGEQGVGGRPMGRDYYELDAKLAFMDALGIDRSVVSLGNPWLDPFPTNAGDAAALAINEIMSGYENATNGRVVALGVLPTSSADAAAQMVEKIAGWKGLHGIVSGPKIAGLDLDSPELDVFWQSAARCDTPILIHPENGIAAEYLKGFRHTLHVGLGFPLETTIAVTRLVFGGVLERFPDLRIVLAHGGGALPYLSGRLDAAWKSDPQVRNGLPKPPSFYLKLLYYDALVYHSPALTAAVEFAGASHLMFGTDHPFSIADPEVNLEMIRQNQVLEKTTQYPAMMAANAAEFFGL
jgi:predicted TIM-barrel fold metal-dependent hydrolase